MTDQWQNQTAAYSYDAWGRILTASGDDQDNPYKFTSREWEDEIGLQFNRARFYCPEIGRFISPDPLTGGPDDPTISYFSGVYSQFHRFLREHIDGLQPHKLNRYVYCYNNPVNLIDPLGLEPERTLAGPENDSIEETTGIKAPENAGQPDQTCTENQGDSAENVGEDETGDPNNGAQDGPQAETLGSDSYNATWKRDEYYVFDRAFTGALDPYIGWLGDGFEYAGTGIYHGLWFVFEQGDIAEQWIAYAVSPTWGAYMSSYRAFQDYRDAMPPGHIHVPAMDEKTNRKIDCFMAVTSIMDKVGEVIDDLIYDRNNDQ